MITFNNGEIDSKINNGVHIPLPSLEWTQIHAKANYLFIKIGLNDISFKLKGGKSYSIKFKTLDGRQLNEDFDLADPSLPRLEATSVSGKWLLEDTSILEEYRDVLLAFSVKFDAKDIDIKLT